MGVKPLSKLHIFGDRSLPKALCFGTGWLAAVIACLVFVGPFALMPEQWDQFYAAGDRSELQFMSLDGIVLHMAVYPSPRKTETLVLLLPDLYNKEKQKLQALVHRLRADVHVAVLIPRGHYPSNQFASGRLAPLDYMVRDYHSAQMFFLDYLAAIDALKANEKVASYRVGRLHVIAGEFHSSLLLKAELPGVASTILLSPHCQFFGRGQCNETSEPQAEQLIIADETFAFDLKALAIGDKRKKVFLRGAGSGFSMLARKPEIEGHVRDFLLR